MPARTKTTKKRINPLLRADILTIFPDAFDSYFRESLIKRARQSGILDLRVHNLRDAATDKHQKVDDRPFGGGPGMVLKVEPVYKWVRKLSQGAKPRVILFSTRGKIFDSKTARRLSREKHLVLICGRYEGVDERVAGRIADEEISMGNYILSGGELPAMVLIEAVARFIPGFLGKFESLEEVKGSYPVYTRPEEFTPKKGKKSIGRARDRWIVPKVLLSGDHAKIEAWRRQKSRGGR